MACLKRPGAGAIYYMPKGNYKLAAESTLPVLPVNSANTVLFRRFYGDKQEDY